MRRFLLSRAWQSAVTLVLASIVVFIGVRLLPGDPAVTMAGEDASAERIAALRQQLGLDEPVVLQYFRFVASFVQGDWGRSTRTGAQVTDMVGGTLPVTVQLAAFAVILALIVGLVLGIIAERYRGRWPEWASNALALTWLSVPSFWIGLILILLFAAQWGIFPASGYDTTSLGSRIHSLTLPAAVLGFGLAAVVMRQTRAAMIMNMRSDFVRTARAKGLPNSQVVLRYGLRNSLIVVVTIVGLQMGALISGAVVTERIFALPGFGKLILDAVFSRDYPVIQIVVLIVTAAYVVINLIVDIIYTLLDPRIRIAKEPA